MAGIPAHCTRCRYVFVSPLIQVSGGGTLGISNVGVTCPRCGGVAQAADGTFGDAEGRPVMLSGTPRSAAIMAVLEGALNAARQGQSIESIITPIRQASPELADIVTKEANRGGIYAVICMLLYLMTSCAQHSSTSLNLNQLVDQAHVYATGSEAYPGLGDSPAEPQSTGTVEKGRPPRSEKQSGPSRQQRRQIERQAKKHLPKSASSPSKAASKKPKR